MKSRIQAVQARIAAAAGRVGRDPAEVSLMAVTKTYSRDIILGAYEAGIRIFGENRTAEGEEKFLDVPKDLELHLIGHLQTNKARTAAQIFSWVDSIDSYRVANALNRRLEGEGKTAQILLQLNTSGEASKSGYGDFSQLLEDLPGILALPQLQLRGLFTIGPLHGGEEAARASFRLLKNCFLELKERPDCQDLDTLSMGMSGDFEIAVEEGSTMVRLGSLLFGKRRP